MGLFPIQMSRLRTSKLMNSGYVFAQKANIMSRSTRGSPLQLQKPFPYEDKKFTWFHRMLDKTVLRLAAENAKIIVIEGPIAVGKTAFAKALAEEFDMLHIEEANHDFFYVLPSGYDIRQHNHEWPENLRTYDSKDFCLDPKNVKANQFQLRQLYARFFQFADALAHLFNTGQGVVLERSYFSDFVFANAMYKNKYITKNGLKVYKTALKNTSTFLLPPHLTIYLDIPVPVVQERIRTRNYSYEQNSPALTTQYLQDLEYNWKQVYLPRARNFNEVLIYDWTDGGDVELICEDIEKIDFEKRRFKHWELTRSQLNQLRELVTNEKHTLSTYFNYPISALPECHVETYKWYEALQKVAHLPECQYDVGYNRAAGGKFWNILFKTNEEKHRQIKSHLLWPEMSKI